MAFMGGSRLALLREARQQAEGNMDRAERGGEGLRKAILDYGSETRAYQDLGIRKDQNQRAAEKFAMQKQAIEEAAELERAQRRAPAIAQGKLDEQKKALSELISARQSMKQARGESAQEGAANIQRGLDSEMGIDMGRFSGPEEPEVTAQQAERETSQVVGMGPRMASALGRGQQEPEADMEIEIPGRVPQDIPDEVPELPRGISEMDYRAVADGLKQSMPNLAPEDAEAIALQLVQNAKAKESEAAQARAEWEVEKKGKLAKAESSLMNAISSRQRAETELMKALVKPAGKGGASPNQSADVEMVVNALESKLRNGVGTDEGEEWYRKFLGSVGVDGKPGDLSEEQIARALEKANLRAARFVRKNQGREGQGFRSGLRGAMLRKEQAPTPKAPKIRGGRSTAAERAGVRQGYQTIMDARDLRSKLERYDPNTGFIPSSVQKLFAVFGVNGQSATDIRASATALTSDFLRMQSGLTVTDSERRMLQDAIFTYLDDQDAGLIKLDNFIDRVTRNTKLARDQYLAENPDLPPESKQFYRSMDFGSDAGGDSGRRRQGQRFEKLVKGGQKVFVIVKPSGQKVTLTAESPEQLQVIREYITKPGYDLVTGSEIGSSSTIDPGDIGQ
jgi:hypothetical protein